MKAIRKEDGKEIEVRLYTEKQYVATENEEGEVGKRIYFEDSLIIKEAVDWEAFRREAVEVEVTETCGIASVWLKTKQFKPGQKVKLIIVKEDEK